jgi:hypothetical protein
MVDSSDDGHMWTSMGHDKVYDVENSSDDDRASKISVSSTSDDDGDIWAAVIAEDDEEKVVALNLLFEADMAQSEPLVHGGSRPGKKSNLPRDLALGHRAIWRDYFASNPTYPENIFRRRFRMPRPLFILIVDKIAAHDPQMRLRLDAARRPGLSSIQKCTAAMRILAYGASADSLDEYIRIGESTALAYFKRFCHNICNIYGGEFLRPPNGRRDARIP